MKKIGSVVVCCLAVAGATASGALAGEGSAPSPAQVASQQCSAELHAMGVKAFKGLYGTHAMRTCKGKHATPAENAVDNAAQQCKAEQSDPDFPAAHGSQTFDEVYGTNHNGRNSFGK